MDEYPRAAIVLATLQFELSWIDLTSLGIVLVFGVLGLFRGLLWQVSRLASIIISFSISNHFAQGFADFLEEDLGWFTGSGSVSLYVAYFTVFLAVLIVLSLITMLLDRLLKRFELKFYDYLGGGIFGVVSGAALVFIMLGLTIAIAPQGGSLIREVQASHAASYSEKVASQLGDWLVPEVRQLYVRGSSGTQEASGQKDAQDGGAGEGLQKDDGQGASGSGK